MMTPGAPGAGRGQASEPGAVEPLERLEEIPGTDSAPEELGPTLRDVLRARRMSISELARELDVSRPQLSNALAGKRAARYSYFLAVGNVLGLTTEETRARLVQAGAPRGLNTFYEARVEPGQ